MTNEEALRFAYDSYVTAFEVGNEHLIDDYFDEDLELCNHSVAKNYQMQAIKSGALEFYKKYRDLKSEIKDVIVQENRIAFRVEHQAFFVPDSKQVNIAVMNLYKIEHAKVKEWQLWFSQTPSLT